MKKRGSFLLAVLAVLFVTLGPGEAGLQADPGGGEPGIGGFTSCSACTYVYVPDPEGSGGRYYSICWDFGSGWGWEYCEEVYPQGCFTMSFCDYDA